MARRSRSARAPAARSATSAPTPTTSPIMSAASRPSNSAPISPRSAPAARSTTTCRSCCATPMARAARCGRARSRRATRTACACASTGPRAASTGCRPNPNQMLWSPFGQSTRIVTRGGPDSGAAAARVTRMPPGHPEGYLEGFANIYTEVAAGDQSRARRARSRRRACISRPSTMASRASPSSRRR